MGMQAFTVVQPCIEDMLGTACQPEQAAEQQGTTRLLVVETQTCGSFMRANVSLGPPRHAAQLGAAGATHPAASNTCAHSLRQTRCWFCRPRTHPLTPGTAYNAWHESLQATCSTLM